MPRTAKDDAGETLFHHLAVLHDSSQVANLCGHPEIAGNEDDGETQRKLLAGKPC